MMLPAKISSFLLFFSAVLLPCVAFSGVKIEMKNGRTIIADLCEEAGGVFTCSRMGGTFNIDKKDVANIWNIADGNGESLGGGTAGEAALPEGAQKSQTEGKMEGVGEMIDAPSEGRVPNAGSRAADIRKRKADIAPERDKLLKEREQLQEDLNRAPDWMTTQRYEELQRRNTELDEKIKKYNEEVDRLNREDKRPAGEPAKEQD